ncbi:MAG: AfsR/SARP family transcriptional regulator [Christensenellales bacterium]|jgi:DNA-binding SARP family transcriptional activator
MPSDAKKYRVQMLGGFSITSGEDSLSDSAGRMQQVWNLIEYLIVYRHKVIPQSRLIDMLWPDDSSENPSNALKNLAYRARTLLAKSLPNEKEPFILFRRNSYAWNEALPCEVDIEILESSWRAANAAPSEEDKLSGYLTAVDIYQGEFLPKSLMEEWTISLRTYYSSIYIDCVTRAFDLLLAQDRATEAVQMCEKAVILEKFTEKMHELLVRAYMAAGDHASALKHYYYVVDLFYTEMGVKISSQITSLYNEIIKSISSIEADLEMIEEQLHEVEAKPGAYFCPYEIFKNIYRIQSRFMLRSGQSFMVALITVSDKDGNPPATPVVTAVMEELKNALVSCLRKSDIVSRFSPTQYVLLLGALTYENGQMVISRIFERFKKRSTAFGIELHYNLLPVKPVM